MNSRALQSVSNHAAGACLAGARPAAAAHESALGRLSGLVRRIGHRLEAAHRRRAAIGELQALTDHQLRDIGIRREGIAEVVDTLLEREQRRAAVR